MWKKAILLGILLSSWFLWYGIVNSQDVRSESFTHEDYLEACAYIEKNVEVKWTCKDIVEPEIVYNMADKWQAYYYAYTIAPNSQGLITGEVSGPNGKIVFEPVQQRSTFWKGLLIHELCHHIDNTTKEGCKCDPFDLQYKYHREQGEDQWKDQIWHGIKHDSHRVCYWRNLK